MLFHPPAANHDPLMLSDHIRSIPDFPKPGILFRDITPLLSNPAAFRTAVVEMANPFRREKSDVVAAAEARGFIFAAHSSLPSNEYAIFHGCLIAPHPIQFPLSGRRGLSRRRFWRGRGSQGPRRPPRPGAAGGRPR